MTTASLVGFTCAGLTDAGPGTLVIEWALETGTSPTQTIRAGSYYVLSTKSGP